MLTSLRMWYRIRTCHIFTNSPSPETQFCKSAKTLPSINLLLRVGRRCGVFLMAPVLQVMSQDEVVCFPTASSKQTSPIQSCTSKKKPVCRLHQVHQVAKLTNTACPTTSPRLTNESSERHPGERFSWAAPPTRPTNPGTRSFFA